MRDNRDVMMQHVCFNDIVQQMPSHEPEIPIDGAGGAAHEGPCGGVVMRKRAIVVVEVDYVSATIPIPRQRQHYQARTKKRGRTEPVIYP